MDDVLVAFASAAVAQDKAKGAPADTKTLLATLKSGLKAGGQPALDALEAGVAATKEPKRAAREKEQIMKAMALGLNNKNPKIKVATATALGRVGKPAAKTLAAALKNKYVQKNKELLNAIIDAIGITTDEKYGASALLEIIKVHKDWHVRAAAGAALSNFDKSVSRSKTRKKICEKIIQILEGIESKASSGKDSDAKRKHDAIRGPFLSTLSQLTDYEANTALQWRKWFNDNRKKKWPEPPKKKAKKGKV